MTLASRLVVFISFAGFSSIRGQSLEIRPNRILIDEQASIRAIGLKAGERVNIQSELVDGMGEHWTAQADFVADAEGNIDTAKQPALAGSYREISTMGLIWSMMPASRKTGRYQVPRDIQPIEFRLMRGKMQVASAHLEQIPIAEGVQRVRVHEGALRGTLFLPAGKDRHPGVLTLGGSEGGQPSLRAAWLASHGYAALALAYFRF